MTVGGVPAVPFVTPEAVRALGTLLQRSSALIESEIRGSSMGSTIPDRAKVRIACRMAPEYQPGDVVAYWWGDSLIAHRIVGRGTRPRTRGFYLTRGDGHYLCDPAVSEDAILGLVSTWFDGTHWLPVATFPAHGVRRWTILLGQWMLELHPHLARRIAAVCSALLQWTRLPFRPS
jgi:hypothetical protein